ncbi:hypothetical protein ANDROMEDA_7 [Bacillus phage Andromeda]|uniref:Uncharacterized protein n=4 Tax=Andromedavirus TaxID=1623275 RepID=M1I9I4_9CAUD|nr:hypothetical protein I905_gp07 [Bacillus phage Andromeda]YP_007517551.1 hypothetical protein I906_gp07 [Bacillus phage Curly]YP_008770642.1 hypothetical protein Glittering_6 [Bacillus phage Glittering]AGE60846.1 hypothetical protein GEMINI_7 [Bacillus phage Gemini]AGE60694.1 hypothetical protein CURLY_7 [Bacillus phage Curly]AGE61077.1 hypothetical protein ANDROMEDA_7 [Bacillus phage Andromeda]AGY47193.1 hypothetical protein Glittering_6 [Bacillus phage Glittering]
MIVLYKQVYMKDVNVVALLNGEESYGHRKSDLERYGVPAYSVMVHTDDISHCGNLPYTEYIEPKARFHSLMSMNIVASTRIDKNSWFTEQNPKRDKDYWWKV